MLIELSAATPAKMTSHIFLLKVELLKGHVRWCDLAEPRERGARVGVNWPSYANATAALL